MTHTGYVKSVFPVTGYHAQNRGGKGNYWSRPQGEDFVERMFMSVSSHDEYSAVLRHAERFYA